MNSKKQQKPQKAPKSKAAPFGTDLIGHALFGAAVGLMAGAMEGIRCKAKVVNRNKRDHTVTLQLVDLPPKLIADLKPNKVIAVRLPALVRIPSKLNRSLQTEKKG